MYLIYLAALLDEITRLLSRALVWEKNCLITQRRLDEAYDLLQKFTEATLTHGLAIAQ